MEIRHGQPFSSPDANFLLDLGLGFDSTTTFTLLSLNHFCVTFAVASGHGLARKCFPGFPYILLPSLYPLPFTSLSGPAAVKHPHSMMLPPLCFMVGMVCVWWCAVFGV